MAADDGGVRVRHAEPTRSVFIGGIPEGTASGDVRDALCSALGEDYRQRVRVGPLAHMAAGSMRCTAYLPDCAASRDLTHGGRLVVGLVRCRLREKTEVTRCYRCLGFGHVAARCRGLDRSTLCGRCGDAGHKAQGCERTPKCVVCAEHNSEGAAHVRGSGSCPNFQRALKEARGK